MAGVQVSQRTRNSGGVINTDIATFSIHLSSRLFFALWLPFYAFYPLDLLVSSHTVTKNELRGPYH